MRKITGVLVICYLFMSAGMVFGQQADIEILDVKLPEGKWGERQLEIKVFSHSEYIKFLVVKSELEFIDSEPLCRRETKSSTYIEPGSEITFRPVVEIPGNYGKATLRLELYDVIDTMDAILPGQELFDTTLTFEIVIPELARPLMGKTVFPPRVDEHPYFNSHFVRILFPLLDEGKSREEIADITGTDSLYVQKCLSWMAGHRFLKHDGEAYQLTFPVISSDEAKKAEKLASKTAKKLAKVITENMKDYRPTLDSLVEAGVATRDSNNVLGTSTALYRPDCIISALLLWQDLGAKFISGGRPLTIYERTDFCNALITNFMYAAPSEEKFNGHHFYAHTIDRSSWRIIFADHLPKLHCSGNFPAQRGVPTKAHWKSDADDRAEFFLVDTTIIRPLLNTLDRDTDEIIKQMLESLKEVAADYEREKISAGYRYWFWNLTATLTLDRLIEKETIKFRGNPYYNFGAKTRR